MNTMADILRRVINSGGLTLSQVSERIETMYISGRINAEERDELTGLMHEKARPENEAGDYKVMYRALAEKYNELEKRVKVLEAAGGEAEGGEEGTQAIPEWKPWDGVSAGYKLGDVVAHGGKIWENMLSGMGNVWEPGAPGVDERYWREV